jgi:hypothetical protein
VQNAGVIRDIVGSKVANLPSMSGHVIYANGTTDPLIAPGVAAWGGELTDDLPIATVGRGTTDTTAGDGTEVYRRNYVVTFWVSAIDAGAAHQWVDQLEDELRYEFEHGIQLGGRVSSCLFVGSAAPVKRDDQDRPMWVWDAYIRVEEINRDEYTA